MIQVYPSAKLALGTVQFGVDYGISNVTGQTSQEEVRAILKAAIAYGIETIDTAFQYGNSEAVLGECMDMYPFKIISKFPKPAQGRGVRQYLEKSLEALKRDSVEAYIAHDSDVLLENPLLWNELAVLRSEGLLKKRGYSLYKPCQLQKLLDNGLIPDIVQVPYNVFDIRFESFFSKLKELGTEIHVRSAFLQGLFFIQPETLPPHFVQVKETLLSIQKLFESKEALAAGLMHFCLRNNNVDKVVIGVNTTLQLRDNLKALNESGREVSWENFNITDESILLPYNWPKKSL